SVMPGQRLTRQADVAAVDRLAAACAGRRIQQTRLAERANESAAGAVGIGMVDAGKGAGCGIGIELYGECPVAPIEEWPVEMIAGGAGKLGGTIHLNPPRRPACASPQRLRRLGGNPLSPYRRPVLGLPTRSSRRCPSPIPGSASSLSLCGRTRGHRPANAPSL